MMEYILLFLWLGIGLLLYLSGKREGSEEKDKSGIMTSPLLILLWPVLFLVLSPVSCTSVFIAPFIGGLIGYKYSHPVIGALTGLGVYILLLCLIGLFLKIWDWWRPLTPPCGKCGSSLINPIQKDKLSEQEINLIEKYNGQVFACQCGTRYLLSRSNRSFNEITPDGTQKPCMSHTPLGRWKK